MVVRISFALLMEGWSPCDVLCCVCCVCEAVNVDGAGVVKCCACRLPQVNAVVSMLKCCTWRMIAWIALSRHRRVCRVSLINCKAATSMSLGAAFSALSPHRKWPSRRRSSTERAPLERHQSFPSGVAERLLRSWTRRGSAACRSAGCD